MTNGPAAAATPPPTADPQDPLPESNWLWRRLLAFMIVGVIGWQQVMAGNRIARWGDKGAHEKAIDALLDMTHWHISALGGLLILYMIAPSAEQVAKILSTLSAWKSGISTTSTSRAVAPDGSMAEATTSAGKPKPPAEPAFERGPSPGDSP